MFRLKTYGKYKVALGVESDSTALDESIWNFHVDPSLVDSASNRPVDFHISLSEIQVRDDRNLFLTFLKKSCGIKGLKLREAGLDLLHYFLSQLYYGEIAAYHISSKIFRLAPLGEVKDIMARQVQDEMTHAFLLEQTLTQSFGAICRIDPFIKEILEAILKSNQWSQLLLGMQIIFEGTALSLIDHVLDVFQNQQLSQLLRVIQQDEGRHCFLGQKSLKMSDKLSSQETEELRIWTAEIIENLSYSLLSGQFFFMQNKYGLQEDRDLKLLRFFETRETLDKSYFRFVMPMLLKNEVCSETFLNRMKNAGVMR